MRFFTEMGIPAPRVVHARLFVNNAFAGLYTIVESIDKDFLKQDPERERRVSLRVHAHRSLRIRVPWGRSSRNTRSSSSRRPTRTTRWRRSTGRSRSWRGRSANRPTASSSRPWTSTWTCRTFLKYAAVENFLADRDGVLGDWGMNNFYLYRFEDKTVSQLLPWDKDSSFWAVDYDIWTNMEANALARRALKEPPLQRVYLEALRRCAELALRRPEPVPGLARRKSIDETPGPGWLEREVSFIYSQIRAIAAGWTTRSRFRPSDSRTRSRRSWNSPAPARATCSTRRSSDECRFSGWQASPSGGGRRGIRRCRNR